MPSAEPRPPRLRALPQPGHREPAETGRPDGEYESVAFDFAPGESAVLTAATLDECRLSATALPHLDLRSARLINSRVDAFAAAEVSAAHSHWRATRLRQCRIGSLDLADAQLGNVSGDRLMLGYVNLSGATLADVEFVECDFGTIDALRLRARRVRFTRCTADELDLGAAALEDVDLRGLDVARMSGLDGVRGATVTPEQLTAIAPELARAAGLRIHV